MQLNSTKSQLSGRLVETLPIELHQFGIEDNPWNCDCRLVSLKRWIEDTRTPLSAPTKCWSTGESFEQQATQAKFATEIGANKRTTGSGELPVGANGKRLRRDDKLSSAAGAATTTTTSSSSSLFIDQISLDYFVCPPRAIPVSSKFTRIGQKSPFKVERSSSATLPKDITDIGVGIGIGNHKLDSPGDKSLGTAQHGFLADSLSGETHTTLTTSIGESRRHMNAAPIEIVLDYLGPSLIVTTGPAKSETDTSKPPALANTELAPNRANFVVNATQGESYELAECKMKYYFHKTISLAPPTCFPMTSIYTPPISVTFVSLFLV